LSSVFVIVDSINRVHTTSKNHRGSKVHTNAKKKFMTFFEG